MSVLDRFRKTPQLDAKTLDVLDAFDMGYKPISLSNTFGQSQSYSKCSSVMRAVNKRATAARNFTYWAKDANGEDVERPKERAIIESPNEYQTLQEFVESVEVYKSLFGVCYIHVFTPGGRGRKYLYIIPNELVTEKQLSKRANPLIKDDNISHYEIPADNGTMRIEKSEMVKVYDTNKDLLSVFSSKSRLVSLENKVNTFIASTEAENELTVNRGVLGIITLDSGDIGQNIIPKTKEEKDDVQRRMRVYGQMKGQFKYIVTTLKSAFTKVSGSLEELKAAETQKSCRTEISTAFGVPPTLMEIDGATFNNASQYNTAFYEDEIIPSVEATFRAINKAFDFKGFEFKPFFDHLAYRQESKRQQAAGMVNFVNAMNVAVTSGLMTLDEAKEQLNNFQV